MLRTSGPQCAEHPHGKRVLNMVRAERNGEEAFSYMLVPQRVKECIRRHRPIGGVEYLFSTFLMLQFVIEFLMWWWPPTRKLFHCYFTTVILLPTIGKMCFPMVVIHRLRTAGLERQVQEEDPGI